MAINYLFFSLQRSEKLAPPFEQLWNIFWNTYLKESGDSELTAMVAPFFAWRALVLASPVWYNVADSVRQSLLGAAESVLRSQRFDPAQINTIIQPSSVSKNVSTDVSITNKQKVKELPYEPA